MKRFVMYIQIAYDAGLFDLLKFDLSVLIFEIYHYYQCKFSKYEY